MSEKEFCYWLQGMFELTDPKELTEAQTKMIKDHLQLVFKKVTLTYGSGTITQVLKGVF